MLLSPLLAFGFESLPMLGWMAAAAAPWVIHLLSRRKYQETPWAAMDFLLAAVKRRAARLRFEQLLLLLLRTLVIVAIVLAVAQPYFERVGAIFSPGGNTHRVLVIDASYSMSYKSSDRSRFEQAKQWAAQIVEHALPGDGFTLVEMADPPRVIVSAPALEAAAVRQEIENLELLHTGADVPATLAEVRKLLDDARRDSPRLTHREVYFFSDMQRARWSPAGGTAKTELRDRMAELAAIASLHLIDLGQPDDDNLAVTALEVSPPMVLVGRAVDLTATLRDFGHAARKRQLVDLLVGSQVAGRQYIDIPPGGEAVARFTHRFTTPGEHAVEVRASGDNLETDNRRYLVVDVRQAVRVLCIDGRPAGDPTKASVYALSNALLARSGPDERSPIEVEIASESAVQERNLARYDCVMLSNVARFTAGEAKLLENYLSRGGSLVFFLGDRVVAKNYNEVLADVPRPVLPAWLGEIVKNIARTLDPLDYRHPIVQKFRGRENAQLLSAPIERYFQVRPLDVRAELAARPPQVALAMGNGDPLIVTRAVRNGRVVLVTTSANNSWTMLPAFGTYLPLVRQVLDWCLAGQTQRRNLFVGETLESSLDGVSTLANVTIERPDGTRRRLPVAALGDRGTWSYDDTRTSGFYTVQFGVPASRTELFAVNVATAESNLASVSREELQSNVLTEVPFDYQTAWQAAGTRLPLPENTAGLLHVGLLYGVVALLLAETILAWRLGFNR